MTRVEWCRQQLQVVTCHPLYRRRVHQLRALVWIVASAVGQILAQRSADEILAWDRRRWVLALGAIAVPALLLSMKAGEFNPPIPLDRPVEKP